MSLKFVSNIIQKINTYGQEKEIINFKSDS